MLGSAVQLNHISNSENYIPIQRVAHPVANNQTYRIFENLQPHFNILGAEPKDTVPIPTILLERIGQELSEESRNKC